MDVRNEIAGTAHGLARRCSTSQAALRNTDLFRGERVAIGAFRCTADYPSFRDTGPIRQCLVVFPRANTARLVRP